MRGGEALFTEGCGADARFGEGFFFSLSLAMLMTACEYKRVSRRS